MFIRNNNAEYSMDYLSFSNFIETNAGVFPSMSSLKYFLTNARNRNRVALLRKMKYGGKCKRAQKYEMLTIQKYIAA